MTLFEQIERNGFAILEEALPADACAQWSEQLYRALYQTTLDGPLSRAGQAQNAYGSRNLLAILPEVVELLKTEMVRQVIQEVLGEEFGIVRGLYFDKPPGVTWSLPWHQDLTIAVAEHPTKADSNAEFSKPTIKAGICHVEAPQWLLESMLTVRVHLDAMGPNNGAVLVRKGSHRFGKGIQSEPPPEAAIHPIHTSRGAVMFMRPLLSHSSMPSDAQSHLHRRVVHLELSRVRNLPAPYRWHTFLEPSSDGKPAVPDQA